MLMKWLGMLKLLNARWPALVLQMWFKVPFRFHGWDQNLGFVNMSTGNRVSDAMRTCILNCMFAQLVHTFLFVLFWAGFCFVNVMELKLKLSLWCFQVFVNCRSLVCTNFWCCIVSELLETFLTLWFVFAVALSIKFGYFTCLVIFFHERLVSCFQWQETVLEDKAALVGAHWWG